MNDISKIMLSPEEQQLVNDPHWILTKRIIMDKVCQLLGYLSERQQAVIEKESDPAATGWLPPAVVLSTPKISKGENYLQLPYVLLDYPRCFSTENIFAVRTLFWWGNFFSMTLHVSGSYKQMFQEKIIKNLASAKQAFFICVHENQWQHHFEADNYCNIKHLSIPDLQQVILKKKFVKLAIQFPLHQWNDVNKLLDESFKEIIDLLKH